MRACVVLSIVFAAAGCFSFDRSGLPVPGNMDAAGPDDVDAVVVIDAAQNSPDAPLPGSPDAGSPDAAMPDAALPDAEVPGNVQLLITEVALAPDANEFIEIYNPGSQAVDLTNYYLSDDNDYALLPGKFGNGPAPGVNMSDFIVRFPTGAQFGPGQVKVVAMDYTAFQNTYGRPPDFAIRNATGGAAMINPGSLVGNSADLSNSGEGYVLFYWDGASDLVADVDMVQTGNSPSGGNRLANKTGVSVDGPDSDTTASIYADDAYTIGLMAATAGAGESHKRIRPEAGYEVQDGTGNGLYGDDETSETITQTWDTNPFSAPTPGLVPPGL